MRNYKKETKLYIEKRNKFIRNLYHTERMTGDEIVELLASTKEYKALSREQVYSIIRSKK